MTGEWRQGEKIKINVYDGYGNPVCQCQTEEYAALIVDAVNDLMKAALKKLGQPK